LSLQKIEIPGFTRLAQPPYSSDFASCDFFLFGYLKNEDHGKKSKSETGVISVARAYWIKISIQTLSRVFDEWIERLHGCIANDWEYV
jgi:hypothetical protein